MTQSLADPSPAHKIKIKGTLRVNVRWFSPRPAHRRAARRPASAPAARCTDISRPGLPADQDPGGITVRWTLQMINRYVVPKNRWLDDVRTVVG